MKAHPGLLLLFSAAGIFLTTASTRACAAGFDAGQSTFLLDKKPFVIRSGEMHYSRIPRDYWQHRLRMARAMGLNTVSTYVFWNVHEPQPGQFNFSGDADVAEFCRLAQQENLKVIIRPGPYCCAEWDFGGLPWWLLQDRNMKPRSRNPAFIEATRRYYHAVGEQLAPLQVTKGGPIILVQVENEYDAYGHDARYISTLHDYLKEVGFEVPCFTAETVASIRPTADPDLFRAVGFGKDPEKHFQTLRSVQPVGPLFCAEYYTGWFDSWGRPSHSALSGPNAILPGLSWMLENRASFNLYMFHGGTSFGFSSGANEVPYRPQPTSYDYGAPLSEAGWPTAKYHAIRELLSRHLAQGEALPPVPPRNPVTVIPPFELNEVAPVLANLPQPRNALHPGPMEMYGQGHGCILYRTKLPPAAGQRLRIREVHDYAVVLLNGKTIGTLDRRLNQGTMPLPDRTEPVTLDLLVEALGRVNFSEQMLDRKGITESAQVLAGRDIRELTQWEIFNLPLNAPDLASLAFRKGVSYEPAFYRARFELSQPGDTFVDLRTWGKGVVWVNGHNLGPYWNIGPQQTLYCPGPWLKKGANQVIVLCLGTPEKRELAGLAEPILNQATPQELGNRHRQPNQALRVSGAAPAAVGTLPRGAGWKLLEFPAAKGRYLCLEAATSQASEPFTSCAELLLLDASGKELPRTDWKILYADSEELSAENGSAENVLDGSPSTFWHTQWDSAKPAHPHHLVIDLSQEQTVTGMKILPRSDSANGQIRDVRVYLSPTKFPGL